MANRRDPSISDIVHINTDSLTYNHMPNYHEKWDAVAYVKGHNGHYYLMKGWYRTYVIRLYTRNQFRASDELSIDVDHDEILNEDGSLSAPAKARFLETVVAHRPYHYVPKVIDSQRKTCYRWETATSYRLLNEGKHLGKTSIANARKYVEHICRAEGMTKMPKIRFTPKGACSYAKGDWELKFLAPGGEVDCMTILHELAHTIDSFRGRSTTGGEAGHGPSFIGLYIEFMVKYGLLDRAPLEATAKAAGLKFHYDRVQVETKAAA